MRIPALSGYFGPSVNQYFHWNYNYRRVWLLYTVGHSISAVTSFTIVEVDFLYVNLYLGVSPRWSGFPGYQDHPSSSYSPDDWVTTVVAKRVFIEIGSFRTDHLGDNFIQPVYFDHDMKKEKII
jgi:hypothetical protein